MLNRLQNGRGFTLIELVLIIVVVAIIGTVVVNIGVDSIADSKLNGAARKLISDLRFAQQVSGVKRIRHGVIFTANTYTVFENDDTADPARNPQGGADFAVDFTVGDFSGVTLATNLTNSVVRFDAAGRPMEGNPVPALLAGDKTVTLTYNGVPKTVTIIQETGKVN